ncbi:bleomycin resistance protein [Micromonospora sp. NPDC003197]
MADERTVPLLPCRSIDETADFYRALGFESTYRQTRPNPYLALRREDLELHFFGLADFDPEQSYGSCLVSVPDIEAIYQAFAEGMRATYGKLLVSGIPRMTRPRRRKNTGSLSGFSVVDPGGNWIRIFQAPGMGAESGEVDAPDEDDVPESRLAKVLQNAIVLGDSKGDVPQAARILDATLAKEEASASAVDRVQALVYRAELAARQVDGATVAALLTRVRAIELTDADRARLADALAEAAELAAAAS